MKKIIVLEKVAFSQQQREKLETLGQVNWYDTSTPDQCFQRAEGADVVVVDWIDASPFILKLKSPSLLALMSTGFAWIKHREEARNRGILISNIPGYATEAVAEHIIGLLLAVARQTVVGSQSVQTGQKTKGGLQGVELAGRTIGIIGLGHIGSRVAKLAKAFGMNVITHNRHRKAISGIRDVSLSDILELSDVVCVSCPLNDESRDMLNEKTLKLIRQQAILVGATWDVVNIADLIPLLRSGHIRGFGFDAAIEGGGINLPPDLRQLDNVVITPHVGFNTVEATIRQGDICIKNIAGFIRNKPINVVN
jgi:lactate dehydrogenase-like 2-hydroxyacid dehydrogenase